MDPRPPSVDGDSPAGTEPGADANDLLPTFRLDRSMPTDRADAGDAVAKAGGTSMHLNLKSSL